MFLCFLVGCGGGSATSGGGNGSPGAGLHSLRHTFLTEAGEYTDPGRSSLVDGVILSAAVLQAERRISCYDTVCNGRSLGPLVRTRALRDDALYIQNSKRATTTDPFTLQYVAGHDNIKTTMRSVYSREAAVHTLFARLADLQRPEERIAGKKSMQNPVQLEIPS